MAGGFLAGADRVVTTFHLPKRTMMSSPPRERHGTRQLEIARGDEKGYDSDAREEPLMLGTYDLDEDLMDAEPTGALSVYFHEGREFVPKTMQQMAEDAAREQARHDEGDGDGDEGEASGQTRTNASLREEASPSASTTAKSAMVEGRVTRTRSGAIKLREKATLGGPGREGSATPRRGRGGGGVRSSFGRRKGGGSDDRRKRRRVGVGWASEDEDEAYGSPDDGGEEGGDGDDETYQVDLGGEDEEDDRRRSTRKKRPRNGRTNKGH